MARVRMITRTIDVTTVKVMVLNPETKAVGTVEAEVYSMNDAKDAELIEAVKGSILPGYIPVIVEGKETKEVIFGMTEAEFLKTAQVIER